MKQLSMKEFTALLALLMSLVALAIDAILPAIGVIGICFGLEDPNTAQLSLTILFVGLSFGQLLYGPLSDSMGRKPAIFIGMIFYILGCLISYMSVNFELFLLGRFLQGFGAASPRIVSLALVRDQYSGDQMAKTMSLIMTVFIVVPALAPGIGYLLMELYSWRAIFFALMFLSIVGTLWLAIRQPETLALEKRRKFSFSHIISAAKEVATHSSSKFYIMASACVFSSFVGYLNSVQQVFHEVYERVESFPGYFALLAVAIGSAGYFNSLWVERIGMRTLTRRALISIFILATVFLPLVVYYDGRPPFFLFLAYLLISFFNFGILFGNFNSLAMEPMGHIAGVAAAVAASAQTMISAPIGAFIGSLFDGNIYPMIMGFFIMSFLSFLCFRMAKPYVAPIKTE